MKVLALGGCGGMGRHAVETLLAHGMCEHLCIADIDESRARDVAGRFGPRATWTRVDVRDASSLKHALRDTDAVMNTVGPFYRFGVHVLKTCIEQGCHYVDINDDWEPTLDMLDLCRQAEASKVTAVIGIGASPGISNMLAVKALGELDSAHELVTGWDLEKAKPASVGRTPTAATIHGIHQLTGRIRCYRGGAYIERRPLEKLMLDYPGIGRAPAWTIGHPEAVTFPRYFPGLKSSTNVMTAKRATVVSLKLLLSLVNLNVISVERAARIAERIEGPGDPTETYESERAALHNGTMDRLPPLFALARGVKNGRPAAVGCAILSAPLGGMGGATGVPLAVGIHLLALGKLTKHGVFAPEGIIDPDDFLDALAPLCTPRKKDSGDLTLITRSWEFQS